MNDDKKVTPEISIRSANETDFVQLDALFSEFAAFERRADKMLNSVERMKAEKDFFHCFVAETGDEKIVGYVTYFYAYYTWTGKSLYMDDLYVTPAFRGKGLGTRLIHQVIDLAKQSACHKLRWQVSNWNKPAIAFYKSLGASIDDFELDCDLILD